MTRSFVSLGSDSYVAGLNRLRSALTGSESLIGYTELPAGCPPHRNLGKLSTTKHPRGIVPFAFKAYALKEAADKGIDSLIWADSCIVPGPRPLSDLWEKIERDGVWINRGGWTNADWTADSAYCDLFPGLTMSDARAENEKIPHVAATAFGVCVKHPTGKAFLDEYYRLASETNAFCGPWQNSAAPSVRGRNTDRPTAWCGPSTTLGHRHDQTAASVIAYRLGVELGSCPEWFQYAFTDETPIDLRCCLVAAAV
jgi:hypothetical protein